MLFFLSANEWHNERTILVYARAECCPLRSSSVGSLKRSVEGERNRGNTVRKGEVALNRIFRNAGVSGKRGLLYLGCNDYTLLK